MPKTALPTRAAAADQRRARRLTSVPGAAEYLDCSPKTIRRMVSSGQLTAYRVGNRMLRIDLNEIDGLLRVVPTAAMSTGGGPDVAA